YSSELEGFLPIHQIKPQPLQIVPAQDKNLTSAELVRYYHLPLILPVEDNLLPPPRRAINRHTVNPEERDWHQSHF
ncbi:hypothetical protein ACJBWD_10645, partial [Streptococcus suis]